MSREDWKNQQIELLILAGMSLFDATSLVEELLERIPLGQEENFQPDLHPDLLRYTQEAIIDARADWMARDAVPPERKRLLEAEEDDPQRRSRELITIGLLGWILSLRDGQYYPESGGMALPQASLHSLLDDVLNERFDILGSSVEDLIAGRLSSAVWVDMVHRELRRLYFQSAALGAGGQLRLTSQDMAALNTLLNSQRGYLIRFVQDIQAGRVTLSEAISRLELYTGHSTSVFWEQSGRRLRATTAVGQTILEKRVLTPAEHCVDCIRYAGQGWQMPGILPEPGRQSACMSKCKCLKVYKTIPTGEVNVWLGTKRN